MIKLDFQADAFATRVDAMVQNITEAHQKMPQTMLDWQANDMRRKRPFLTRDVPGSVATKIWPRSRLELLKRRWSWAKERRGRRTSTRPILRQILVLRLVERFKRMFRETLKWQ